MPVVGYWQITVPGVGGGPIQPLSRLSIRVKRTVNVLKVERGKFKINTTLVIKYDCPLFASFGGRKGIFAAVVSVVMLIAK